MLFFAYATGKKIFKSILNVNKGKVTLTDVGMKEMSTRPRFLESNFDGDIYVSEYVCVYVI